MSRQQKRGRRNFGEQPGRRNNDRWDKDLVKLDKPPKKKPVAIRPVGGILTVGVHFVKFKSTKDGQFTGFMTQCPNWNLAEQEDVDNGCPICKHFHWNLAVPDKYDFLKMPQKYRYLFHAFHVSNIKTGREPKFGLIETHALGLKDIEEAMLFKGSAPDDPQSGYCLNWLVTDAQKKQFKESIKFSPGDNIKVHELKEGVWGINVDGKKVKGIEQDLLSVITAPPTAQELDKKLSDLGLYALLDKMVGKADRSAGAGPSDADDSQWNDDDASSEAGEDWDEKEKEAAAPAAPAEDPDADDWGNDDDNVSEAPAEEASGDDDEWNDDGTETPAEDAAEESSGDEWGEDDDAAPEPEPEKPKKQDKKKGGKKPAAEKKGAEKSAKKEPPAKESDEWGDDGDDDDWD